MLRYGYLLLFVIVLVAPFVLRAAMGVESAGPVEESSARLVIVTPHNQDIRREFAREFAQWHAQKYGFPVELDYRNPGGTNDIKRQLEANFRAAQEAGVPYFPDVQLVWGGGDYFFDVELKPLGILQPIEIDPQLLEEAFPEPTLAGVRLYDHRTDEAGNILPPHWVGVVLSSFGIVYNPDIYSAMRLEAPETWRDLAEPQLAGWLALADPTRSGSAAVAYWMVIQRAMADAEEQYLQNVRRGGANLSEDYKDGPAYQAALAEGWKEGLRQLTLIAANTRYFTDSASQVPTDVANGEAAAGMAIDFYGRVTEESVGSDRIRFVSPPAATAITPDPIGILQGVSGEKLELAERFIEFLLSPEGQRLWILKAGEPGGPRLRALRRPPIRRDLYADQSGWADKVNPFEEAGGFNQRGEWMSLFGDTRPLWAAAWIDSRDALKAAYAKVLAVSDPQRRAELIGELSDLPLEMSDVQKYREERKRLEKEQGDAEEWKARQRVEWARKFRVHYQSVAKRAR